MHGQGHQRSSNRSKAPLTLKVVLKINRSKPKPSTHCDMGRCWISQGSYPKVIVRLSDGHSKAKSSQNGCDYIIGPALPINRSKPNPSTHDDVREAGRFI